MAASRIRGADDLTGVGEDDRAMIKVECEVTVYEIDGKDAVVIGGPTIKVKNHWSRSEFVVVETLAGHQVTVKANDLIAAIANARNTARY